MYTCETCSNKYTSQKSYLSHIESCEEQQERSSSSRKRNSISALSDIEDDRSRSRYLIDGISMKKMIERLLKDRIKYKAIIKKYKSDIRMRIKEHRYDLERNQEYFQEQILALNEEKDDLTQQLIASREEVFNEKERLRSNFLKKIALEKKRLGISYERKNPSNIKLQKNINKLHESINMQIEQKERIKREYDEDIYNRDNSITELKSINNTLSSQLEKMKYDTDNIKQQFVQNLNQQKEDNEKNIAERDSRITKLETQIKTLHDSNTLLRNNNNDAKMKKMRDDCIEALRKQKIEFYDLKQDNMKIKRDLDKVTLERDKALALVESLKASYITNLNTQNTEGEKIISEKTSRIAELERLLSNIVRSKLVANINNIK